MLSQAVLVATQIFLAVQFSSVQFSCSVVSDSLLYQVLVFLDPDLHVCKARVLTLSKLEFYRGTNRVFNMCKAHRTSKSSTQ